MIKAGYEFIHLPLQRAWAPRKPNDLPEWSPVAQRAADPGFWMHQLKYQGRNKRGNKK